MHRITSVHPQLLRRGGSRRWWRRSRFALRRSNVFVWLGDRSRSRRNTTRRGTAGRCYGSTAAGLSTATATTVATTALGLAALLLVAAAGIAATARRLLTTAGGLRGTAGRLRSAAGRSGRGTAGRLSATAGVATATALLGECFATAASGHKQRRTQRYTSSHVGIPRLYWNGMYTARGSNASYPFPCGDVDDRHSC
jgi:hypothetical protein